MTSPARPRSATFVAGLVLAGLGGLGLLGSCGVLAVGGLFSSIFPAVFGTPFGDLDLDRQAARAPGELLGAYPNPALRVGGEPTVRLLYRFDPGSGPRVDEVSVIASHPMAALEPGVAVTVEYLEASPEVSRIEGTRAAVAGWAGAVGLGFGAVGVLMVAVTFALLVAGLVVCLRARPRRER